MHVAGQEALAALIGKRLGKRVVGGAQYGEKQGGLAKLAVLIEVGQLLAGPVDEELLTGLVIAAHDQIDASRKAAVVLAEPGVAVALGMDRAVLGP